jgi:protein involved in polysaccharide export with SLBB domain
MTDLNYVLIKRINKSNQKYFFRQVDLQEAFRGTPSENIKLYDKDEILLLPSLLSTSLITTKIVKDASLDDPELEGLSIEEEWTSQTYLRKSLQNRKSTKDKQFTLSKMSSESTDEKLPEDDEVIESDYYEYSIYNYCNVPRRLVFELEDRETEDPNEEVKDLDLSLRITEECRKQLLDPMLTIAKRDNSPDKLSTINVYGGVHFPGVYPYTKEMNLLDAIKASGGALDGIYDTEVELIRRDNIGNKFIATDSYVSINQAEKTDLSKMDIVTVKKLTNIIRTVEISGEVHFPGIYPISENQSLSELIVRAGGPTVNSDVNAAVFLRDKLREAEIKRIEKAKGELQRKLILASQSTDVGASALDSEQIDQVSSLLQPTEEDLESLGRLVIDLDKIISSSSYDLKLEDGDRLHIPKKQQTVSVIGEVFVPNNHIYDSEISLSEYIKLSGGYTDFADESSLYVIKSDGSILSPSDISSGFFRRNNNIEPGDTLVVPIEVDSFSSLRAATEITQIIYQMAIAAAAVNSF